MLRRAAGLALAALALLAASPEGGAAQVLMSQQEALALAFPAPAQVERRTAFLDARQAEAASRLAGRGVEVKPGVVTYYVGRRGSTPLGVAYFDVHRVRTLPEVVMVVVTPDERIERIEVLKFAEPPQYRAPDGWLAQVEGKRLSPDLAVGRGVVNMTGATLTADAVVAASRRVLALHRTIGASGAPRPAERK
ncbi:MAG TPA: FMN-binding protein [Longimicrobiaceae bacterium]|nr:FMN-binding protein [Longimicrobiaceae bacterium]